MRGYIGWTASALAATATIASSAVAFGSVAQTPVTATVGTEVGIAIRPTGEVVPARGTVAVFVQRERVGDTVVMTVVPQ